MNIGMFKTFYISRWIFPPLSLVLWNSLCQKYVKCLNFNTIHMSNKACQKVYLKEELGRFEKKNVSPVSIANVLMGNLRFNLKF